MSIRAIKLPAVPPEAVFMKALRYHRLFSVLIMGYMIIGARFNMSRVCFRLAGSEVSGIASPRCVNCVPHREIDEQLECGRQGCSWSRRQSKALICSK